MSSTQHTSIMISLLKQGNAFILPVGILVWRNDAVTVLSDAEHADSDTIREGAIQALTESYPALAGKYRERKITLRKKTPKGSHAFVTVPTKRSKKKMVVIKACIRDKSIGFVRKETLDDAEAVRRSSRLNPKRFVLPSTVICSISLEEDINAVEEEEKEEADAGAEVAGAVAVAAEQSKVESAPVQGNEPTTVAASTSAESQPADINANNATDVANNATTLDSDREEEEEEEAIIEEEPVVAVPAPVSSVAAASQNVEEEEPVTAAAAAAAVGTTYVVESQQHVKNNDVDGDEASFGGDDNGDFDSDINDFDGATNESAVSSTASTLSNNNNLLNNNNNNVATPQRQDENASAALSAVAPAATATATAESTPALMGVNTSSHPTTTSPLAGKKSKRECNDDNNSESQPPSKKIKLAAPTKEEVTVEDTTDSDVDNEYASADGFSCGASLSDDEWGGELELGWDLPEESDINDTTTPFNYNEEGVLELPKESDINDETAVLKLRRKRRRASDDATKMNPSQRRKTNECSVVLQPTPTKLSRKRKASYEVSDNANHPFQKRRINDSSAVPRNPFLEYLQRIGRGTNPFRVGILAKRGNTSRGKKAWRNRRRSNANAEARPLFAQVSKKEKVATVQDDSNSDQENTIRCHNTTLNNEGDQKQPAVLDAIVNTESNTKATLPTEDNKKEREVVAVAAAPHTKVGEETPPAEPASILRVSSKEGKCEQSSTLKNWTSDPYPMPHDQKESEIKDIKITWKEYYGSESAGERTNESKVQFQSDENLCHYHPITKVTWRMVRSAIWINNSHIREMRKEVSTNEEFKEDHALIGHVREHIYGECWEQEHKRGKK